MVAAYRCPQVRCAGAFREVFCAGRAQARNGRRSMAEKVADAVEELDQSVAGLPIEVQQTRALGCKITPAGS